MVVNSTACVELMFILCILFYPRPVGGNNTPCVCSSLVDLTEEEEYVFFFAVLVLYLSLCLLHFKQTVDIFGLKRIKLRTTFTVLWSPVNS